MVSVRNNDTETALCYQEFEEDMNSKLKKIFLFCLLIPWKFKRSIEVGAFAKYSARFCVPNMGAHCPKCFTAMCCRKLSVAIPFKIHLS